VGTVIVAAKVPSCPPVGPVWTGTPPDTGGVILFFNFFGQLGTVANSSRRIHPELLQLVTHLRW
jgi:hypothetical protein